LRQVVLFDNQSFSSRPAMKTAVVSKFALLAQWGMER
jgi:hypothetical protein